MPTKTPIVKVMVFPVVMYACESWTVKKAERWRTNAFKLWHWRRLLRVPWTARRSNQSILKEINPEYSLEGWMLKLKLQYSGHLTQRARSLEKTLMLGKTEGRRSWQRMRWLDSNSDSTDINLNKLEEMAEDGGACSPWVTEWDRTQWLDNKKDKRSCCLPFPWSHPWWTAV